MVVGTTLAYAPLHQRGGNVEVVLTPTGRRNLAEFLKQRRDLSQALGWLFNRPRFMVAVRPRPFLAITRDDRAAIQRLVEAYTEAE